ncbi:MAG: hypothetical protein ACKVWR_14060 [Acidimicrobiales bacterium]
MIDLDDVFGPGLDDPPPATTAVTARPTPTTTPRVVAPAGQLDPSPDGASTTGATSSSARPSAGSGGDAASGGPATSAAVSSAPAPEADNTAALTRAGRGARGLVPPQVETSSTREQREEPAPEPPPILVRVLPAPFEQAADAAATAADAAATAAAGAAHAALRIHPFTQDIQALDLRSSPPRVWAAWLIWVGSSLLIVALWLPSVVRTQAGRASSSSRPRADRRL